MRRFISIPRAYYWETGNADLPFSVKAWHVTVSFFGSTVRLAERLGFAVVGILGLNSSQYEYVTSTMTEDEWAAARVVDKKRRVQRQQVLDTESQREDEGKFAENMGATREAL